MPGNILLMNPPNANGALLTETITNRTNIPFFSVSNSSFIRVFININTSHIHSLFSRTGGGSPYVVFVSRVSTMNHRENTNLNNNGSRHRRALGRLLIRVSNFNTGRNMVLVTTAGEPSILSPTLVHPNEFSHRIIMDCPSIGNHRTVLEIRTEGGPLTPSMGLGAVTGAATKFANTSLRGLLGRTTLLTTEGSGGTVAVSRVGRTAIGIIINTRGGDGMVDRGRGGLATCRRTNRTVLFSGLRARSPIRRVSVVPANVTNNCAVPLPDRSGSCGSHENVCRSVIMDLNNQITRRLVVSSVSANTSGSVRGTAGATHTVIAGCNVAGRLNYMYCNASGGSMFLNESVNDEARSCSRTATTGVSRLILSVIGGTCNSTAGVLDSGVSGLRSVTGCLVGRRGVNDRSFATMVGNACGRPRRIRRRATSGRPSTRAGISRSARNWCRVGVTSHGRELYICVGRCLGRYVGLYRIFSAMGNE